MSDKLTRIYAPRDVTPASSLRIGIGDWGEKTCAEMIHNSANECIRIGVKSVVAQAPIGFCERYEEALNERRRK